MKSAFLLIQCLLCSGVIAQNQTATNFLQIPFPDDRIQVAGLAWYQEDKPVLRRLPARMEKSVRPAVWTLAQHTSGGRLRFRTNSKKVGITAKAADTTVMHHFTSVGENGLDIYRDHEYMGSAWPGPAGNIQVNWSLSADGQDHDVTIYLPLYKGITIQEIRLDEGARISPASEFKVKKPVVYYGSSITQGGCATNPGLSYQAIVSRWLQVDFINLGMSGNGLGEIEMARAVAEIESSCVVLDYWGNPSLEVYQKTMPDFVKTIREKHPQVPILVVSPYYLPYESLTSPNRVTDPENKRRYAKKFVEERQKEGDANIHYVDGLKMLSREQADGLVDALHANSLGFYFCAQGLKPYLQKALGL